MCGEHKATSEPAQSQLYQAPAGGGEGLVRACPALHAQLGLVLDSLRGIPCREGRADACHMLRLPRLAVASLLAVAARLERTWETQAGGCGEVQCGVAKWCGGGWLSDRRKLAALWRWAAPHSRPR